MRSRKDGWKGYEGVEERTPEKMIGLEMVDHQRSKRSSVQEVLGFRRRHGESHPKIVYYCTSISELFRHSLQEKRPLPCNRPLP
jgi:hypothetical protein